MKSSRAVADLQRFKMKMSMMMMRSISQVHIASLAPRCLERRREIRREKKREQTVHLTTGAPEFAGVRRPLGQAGRSGKLLLRLLRWQRPHL